MESFLKAMDGLPMIVKLILAIFIDLIWDIYRIIKAVASGNSTAIIIAVIFTIPPIAIVSWIMDIITIVTKNAAFDYSAWFGSAK